MTMKSRPSCGTTIEKTRLRVLPFDHPQNKLNPGWLISLKAKPLGLSLPPGTPYSKYPFFRVLFGNLGFQGKYHLL